MADEEYLLNKRYINKNVYTIQEDVPSYLKEQEEFRQFMENQDLDFDDINEENDIDEDLLRQEIPLSIKFEKTKKKNKNKNKKAESLGMTMIPNKKKDFKRFVIEKRHLLYIDSRDRDKLIYTEPNYYKIPLKRQYTNVVAIKLKSTEFTNTQQLIRSTPASLKNNVISWTISNDNTNASTIIYSVALTSGNYNATTLQDLLQTSMNTVKRVNGKYNNFTVDIDIVTDIVKISSIDYETLSNPFSFNVPNEGSNQTIVTVNQSNHGMKPGSSIYIEDAITIGGIDSGDWNATHTVASTSTSQYTFIIGSSATSSESNVGGTSVKIGKGLDFKLLFSDTESPYELLGFPNVDTEFSVIQTNSIESFSYLQQTIIENGLPTNTQVVAITDGLVSPYVILDDENTINGYVRVSIKKVYLPDGSSEGSIYSYVRTNYDHLLETGDEVFIFQDSGNSIYENITIFDHLYGYNFNSLSTEDQTRLTTFVEEICNPAGLMVTVVDANTFKIPVPYVSISAIDDTDNGQITNVVEPNINDPTPEYGSIITTSVNQSLNLSGEKYIFMQSDTIGSGETSGSVSNIFAKIQLASASGADIYNAYIGGYKVFTDTPLTQLNEIDFRFYKNDGELFEFYDNDHSFTLEITEAIQKIDGVGFSSKIGTNT